jgi:DNA-binding NarL/FixJ family response regulator
LPTPEAGKAESSTGEAVPDGDDRTRLLVVDDNEIVRRGLVSLLEREADLVVVGQASNGRDALEQAVTLRPDVILMDVDMPEVDGIEATHRIREAWPRSAVLGLSVHADDLIACAMSDAGASGFLSKGGSVKELLASIRRAASKPG